MNYVKREATTAKSKHSVADFAEIKRSFLRSVVETVTLEEIPPELILNWDQTGIMIIPSSSWTMHERGARRVKLTGLRDKRRCPIITSSFVTATAYLSCSFSGCLLHSSVSPTTASHIVWYMW